MNSKVLSISACIAIALTGSPLAFSQPSVSSSNLPGLNTIEAARVYQTVDANKLVTIPKSHFDFLSKADAHSAVPDSTRMNHLQLVLKPSVMRQVAMEAFIAGQHNPQSYQFLHWLTPKEFGEAFGVVDSDIAAVTSWLTSQGFTVNQVYPNKTQIDFSGTAGQVRQAFHTQENIYLTKSVKHLANASDISVPAALKSVVAGVMGVNDFHAAALQKKFETAHLSKTKKGFVLDPTDGKLRQAPNEINQAIGFGDGTRVLVPNDMATMYGVRTIRNNGVTGVGVTIAVIEDGDMDLSNWDDFRNTFNLTKFNGSVSLDRPAPPSGTNNCVAPSADFGVSTETVLDAEWATAIAPSAHISIASCASYDANFNALSDNFFGGVFIAATNLINNPEAADRPNIISASYGYGEFFTDAASKVAIDLMWAQADAEGISVFVATGDSGSNASFNGAIISGYDGNTAIDANSLATSPHVTGVGGTDTADVLDGTTGKYFASTPSIVGGSALSYVPEIPWNESCGNGVAAKAAGYSSAVAFCIDFLKFDPEERYITSEGGSGGPSSINAKPVWQRQVFGAADDQSRDLPDVSLFAGSYGGYTSVIICSTYIICTKDFSAIQVSGGTSLSSPMFAGIQALIDQGLAARGLSLDQGNAAPTLYALAESEYGGVTGPSPSSLATCNADNGATGTESCIFHNVTRGNNSAQCAQDASLSYTTRNCYFYGEIYGGVEQIGLTTTDANPTSYSPSNKAFGARPGWSFASGLGSVNATNLLIAWRAFANAPAAAPTGAN